jgi:hypothetical protein
MPPRALWPQGATRSYSVYLCRMARQFSKGHLVHVVRFGVTPQIVNVIPLWRRGVEIVSVLARLRQQRPPSWAPANLAVDPAQRTR